MAKLFLSIALVAICLAVANASIVITAFSDSSCLHATSFYSSTAGCGIKRGVAGSSCSLFTEGVYIRQDECSEPGEPEVPVPAGWLALKFSPLEGCDFSEGWELNAVPEPGENIPVISLVGGSAVVLNSTVTCENGSLTISSCLELDCFSYDNAANGVCTNVTTTLPIFYNGIQTSCVAGQITPVAPVAEPVAAPVTAPTAAPVKAPTAKSSSNASVLAVSLTAVAAAALLY